MVAVSSFIAAGALAAGAYSASEQSKAASAAGAAGREGAITGAINAGKQAASTQLDAEEARRLGQVNAERVLVQAREFRSSQKVVAAASGFVTDSGTAATLDQETDNLAQADALAIMFDAGKQYVSGKVGSENQLSSGVSAARQYGVESANKANAMQAQATGTLLSSFANFASSASIQKSLGLTKSGPAVSGWATEK